MGVCSLLRALIGMVGKLRLACQVACPNPVWAFDGGPSLCMSCSCSHPGCALPLDVLCSTPSLRRVVCSPAVEHTPQMCVIVPKGTLDVPSKHLLQRLAGSPRGALTLRNDLVSRPRQSDYSFIVAWLRPCQRVLDLCTSQWRYCVESCAGVALVLAQAPRTRSWPGRPGPGAWGPAPCTVPCADVACALHGALARPWGPVSGPRASQPGKFSEIPCAHVVLVFCARSFYLYNTVPLMRHSVGQVGAAPCPHCAPAEVRARRRDVYCLVHRRQLGGEPLPVPWVRLGVEIQVKAVSI